MQSGVRGLTAIRLDAGRTQGLGLSVKRGRGSQSVMPMIVVTIDKNR
jgi:hypothetical protein